MRRILLGLAAGVFGLSLGVAGASGSSEGWSSGQYQMSTSQMIASKTTVGFVVSQTKVTDFRANFPTTCAGTCSSSEIRIGLDLSGPIPISPGGRFQTTVNTRTNNGAPITVTLTAQLNGKSASGSLQYSLTTLYGDHYSGGVLDFTASLQGAATASMLRAYGDVGFGAQPPYGYPGTPITVDSFSQVADDIASVGARTLRTWWSKGNTCATKNNVETSAVTPDGHFVNSRTYKFAEPGIYTICADLLDSSGNAVTPPVSAPQPPPWPVYPILICPKGTTIYYNPAVGLSCKKKS